jgi:DNA polymerase-1
MFTGERVGLQPRPHLVLDADELTEICDRLATSEFVTVDVETDSLDVITNEVLWIGLATTGQRYLIPVSHPHGELVTAAWTEEVPDMSTVRPYKNNPQRFTKPKKVKVDHPATFALPPEQIRPDIVFRILEPLFFSHDHILVGHNLKFDLKTIAKYYGDRIPEPPYVDTVVLLHIHDESRSDYKLKPYICDWMLGKQSRKDSKMRAAYYPEVAKGGGILTSDINRVAAYLQLDITHTTRMYLDLMGRLPESLLAVLEAEMEVYEVVMQMEYDGISVDISAIEALDRMVVADLTATAAQIAEAVGHEPDLKNINVRRDLSFKPPEEGGQGLPIIRRTKKSGQPQLNKDIMVQLAAQNPVAQLIWEWAGEEKLHSSFTGNFDRFIHPKTNRVHANFKQHGTPTGRFSCEEPNLQQIPVRTERGKLLRRAFVPEHGGSMVVADYDQIELRAIAYMSGDREMIRMFMADEDIHAGAAAAMYGLTLDQVTEEMRANGKTTNFAIGYGSGPDRLSNLFGVSMAEAQRMIDNYYAVYSSINPWKVEVIKRTVATARRDDPYAVPYTAVPPFGRRRRLPELYSPKEYNAAKAQRQAVNAVVQGYCAYIMKQALVRVHSYLRHADVNARIVSQIHDEIVVEVLDRRHEDEVYRLVIDGMESVSFDGRPALGAVPLRASGGIGPNWIEAKKG